jgi:hypothetical protein
VGEDEHDQLGDEATQGEELRYFDNLMNPRADRRDRRLGAHPPQPWDSAVVGEHVDLGPGGSLRQQYRAARRPVGWRHLVVAVAAVLTVGALVYALVIGPDAGVNFWAAMPAAAGMAALTVLSTRLLAHPSPMLAEESRREHATARFLRPLEAAGWVLLHDRLLPGTHHRIPHLAVGPAGLAVVVPLPEAGTIHLVSDDEDQWLYINGNQRAEWQLARKWEGDAVDGAAAEVLSDVAWTGPTFTVLVDAGDLSVRAAVRGQPIRRQPPNTISGMMLTNGARLAPLLRDLPATLAPHEVRRFADALDSAFVPAGLA